MADKAKHAFGALERVDSAIASGVVDPYDILFVKDANGKPYVGWVDKDGNKVVIDNAEDLAKLESELSAQISTKVSADEVEAQLATKVDSAEVDEKLANKADASAVEAIETQLAEKVDAETVKSMIEEHSESVIEIVEF